MLPKSKRFHFINGKKASSIFELKKVIEDIGENEFRHHVNVQRNDFANWIEDVFKKTELANNIREVYDKETLLSYLNGFLKKKHHKSFHKPVHHEKHDKHKKIILKKDKKDDDLSEKELKKIVKETKTVLDEEDAYTERKIRKEIPVVYEHRGFVLREFLYGFVLGLVLGLIMLAIIFNIKLY